MTLLQIWISIFLSSTSQAMPVNCNRSHYDIVVSAGSAGGPKDKILQDILSKPQHLGYVKFHYDSVPGAKWKPEKGSIADMDPEILPAMNELEKYFILSNEFRHQWDKVYPGKRIGFKENLEFAKSRIDLLEDGVTRLFGAHLKKTNMKDHQAMVAGFLKTIQTMRYKLDNIDPDFRRPQAERTLNELMSLCKGTMGEVRAGLILNRPFMMGFNLKDVPAWQEGYFQALGLFRHRMKMGIRGLHILQKDYPSIFLKPFPYRPSGKGEFVSTYWDDIEPEDLDMAFKYWMKYRTYDLLTTKELGEMALIEVKNNRSPWNLDDLIEASDSRKKSYLEQLKETSDVIKMMGLQKKVKLKLLAFGGMDDDVIEEIQEETLFRVITRGSLK